MMGEQFNKLITVKKWKRFGILAFFTLLVIGALAQCGDSVCETDRLVCSESRSNCFIRANAEAASCVNECGESWVRDSNFDTKTCAEPCVTTATEERESCKKRYTWHDAPVQVDSVCETADEFACGRLLSRCFQQAMEVRDLCVLGCQLLSDNDAANAPRQMLSKAAAECSWNECWPNLEEDETWCKKRYAWQGD